MAMRVRWLVLPSVKALVPMWRSAFGFTPLSLIEFQALEERRAYALYIALAMPPHSQSACGHAPKADHNTRNLCHQGSKVAAQ